MLKKLLFSLCLTATASCFPMQDTIVRQKRHLSLLLATNRCPTPPSPIFEWDKEGRQLVLSPREPLSPDEKLFEKAADVQRFMQEEDYSTVQHLKNQPILTDSDRYRLDKIVSKAKMIRENREPGHVN